MGLSVQGSGAEVERAVVVIWSERLRILSRRLAGMAERGLCSVSRIRASWKDAGASCQAPLCANCVPVVDWNGRKRFSRWGAAGPARAGSKGSVCWLPKVEARPWRP